MASLVPALTAAAFLAVSPAALTNDVVAVFNRADWLESVTDARAPAKDATFEWDAAGNLRRQLTAGRDRRFTWDVKQTLTKVEDNGLEAGRYDYGADGLRSKRVTALESVEYVLDGMQVLVEAEGSTSSHPAKRRYHYASAALAVTDISGATRTTKALHLDALGSPTTETTPAGAVAAVRQYDAWGLYRNGTAPGSADTKLGYTGHQYDVETGLVYARARCYDPEYGRFLSRDSVEGTLNSAPSLHRFAYARENPLRCTDASGNCPNCIAGFVGAGIGFLVGFGVSSALQLARGDEFSWKKSLASGVGGAVSGGIAGLTGGASLVTQVGVGAVGGGVAGATTTRAILGEKTTATDIRDDALISVLTFGLGKGIGAAFARSSNGQMTAAIRELEKETIDAAKQAAQQTTRAAVTQAVEGGADDALTAAERQAAAEAPAVGPWANRFPGVQVRKIGEQWAKRVNPESSPTMQAWGRKTIEEQAAALEKLRAAGSPAAQSSLHPSGSLLLEDVGPTLGAGEFLRPAYWAARLRDSRAMGTILNDLKPGNYGAGYRAFDPVLDRRVLGLGVAIGVPTGGAIAGGAAWAWNKAAAPKGPPVTEPQPAEGAQ